MKRIKIFKAYFVLWLFVYFIVVSNLETVSLYFLSTLTFNIAIITLLAIGTFMLLKAAKDLVMIAGTFGVLMYKKRNLSFYIQGIEKVFPSNIAKKIKSRANSGALFFTQQEKDEILSWIEEKFTNQNKYNNFFIGTVLMIGLLGTFSGLLGAISDMGSIVMSLAGSNVDVGKIMAKFSGPLSSMAVGFGSSLFGVISAILLSIKGYLLNKSQASLIDGVENWLNEKTVDSIVDSEIDQKNLQEKQPSFMDIFTEQLGLLSKQIQELNQNSTKFNQEFKNSIYLMQKSQNLQNSILLTLTKSIKENSNKTTKELTYILQKNHKEQHTLLKSILNTQKDQIMEFANLNTNMEDIGYILQNKVLNDKDNKANKNSSLKKKTKNQNKFDLSNEEDFLTRHLKNRDKFKLFQAEV